MSNTNISDVVRYLGGFVDSFDFKRPGMDQSLGRDIAKLGAQRIQDRSIDDLTGFGIAWKPNSETPTRWHPQGYRKWKDDHYGIDEPNRRTGQMLSFLSLYGRTKIDSKEITMIYGIGKPPDKCEFGGTLSDADRKVTDVQKAYFAHTGQGGGARPQSRDSGGRFLAKNPSAGGPVKRPFYEIDESDGKAVAELAQENLNDMIRDANTARGL